MSEQYKIPATRKAIMTSIAQHAALHTATGWRLAAELASIVRLPGSGNSTSAIHLSAMDVVALEYRGLKSQHTVERYVKAWTSLGRGHPEPGEVVEIPDEPFPTKPANEGSRVAADVRDAIDQVIEKHGAEAVTAVVIDRAVESMPFGGERPHVPGEDVPVNVRTEIAHLCADIKSKAGVLGVKLRQASADDIDATSSALASARAALLDVLDPFVGSADEVEQWLRDEATQ